MDPWSDHNTLIIIKEMRHLLERNKDGNFENPIWDCSRVKMPKFFGPDYIAFNAGWRTNFDQSSFPWTKWVAFGEAGQRKIDYILQNHTLVLVNLPEGCKFLGCKWILKKKLKA